MGFDSLKSSIAACEIFASCAALLLFDYIVCFCVLNAIEFAGDICLSKMKSHPNEDIPNELSEVLLMVSPETNPRGCVLAAELQTLSVY